jgi:hypothetical protein
MAIGAKLYLEATQGVKVSGAWRMAARQTAHEGPVPVRNPRAATHPEPSGPGNRK